MPDLPRISIITPSFNQAQYLEKTILSVLGQNYPNLEYMIVDGGSTDGSVDIIRKYSSCLSWWVSETDHGQAEAINKGFSRVTGDLVAWLNSDDMYLKGTLQAVVQAFEENPQCGMVYGDVLSLDGEDHPINVQRFGPRSLEELMSFQIIGQPSVFMRRSILEKAGYLDPQFHFLLDHHLWLRTAHAAPLYSSGQVWSAARFHADAKNIAQARRFGEEAFRMIEWMRTTPDFSQLLAGHQAKIWGGAHWLNAYYLSVGGASAAALYAYSRAFVKDPLRVMKDWKRVLFTKASLFGLGRLEAAFVQKRRQRFSEQHSFKDRFVTEFDPEICSPG